MERTRWTDDRLDDFSRNVSTSLDLLRADIGALDRKLDSKIDALRRDMFLAMVAILVGLLGVIATVAVA
jgi:hypothetical protein